MENALKAHFLPCQGRSARAIAALKSLIRVGAQAAAVQSEAQVVILAPVDRVWELLTRVEQWPRWNPAVQSVRLQGSFTVGSTFVWRSEGFNVASTLREVDVCRRLSWTGKAFGTVAVHGWYLEDTTDGVIVRTSETFDGWLPRLMHGTMRRKLESTLPRWLAALKFAAEGKT